MSRQLDSDSQQQQQRYLRELTREEEQIEIAHAGLRSEYGDFLTLYQIFDQWEKHHFTYEWCQRHFINYRSMKTARKIRDHLLQEVKKFRLREEADQILVTLAPTKSSSISNQKGQKTTTERLEKRLCHAIVAGYYMNAAMQCANDSVYKCLPLPMISSQPNSELRLVYISPQSAFAYSTPSEYVIYQELVFQTKLYMRNVSYVSAKRLLGYMNRWKPVPPIQLSGITPTTTTEKDKIAVKRGREEEEPVIAARMEEKTAGQKKIEKEEDMMLMKRVKTEEETKNPTASTPMPTAAPTSSNQMSAIEQAKLRYLMRKQGK